MRKEGLEIRDPLLLDETSRRCQMFRKYLDSLDTAISEAVQEDFSMQHAKEYDSFPQQGLELEGTMVPSIVTPN